MTGETYLLAFVGQKIAEMSGKLITNAAKGRASFVERTSSGSGIGEAPMNVVGRARKDRALLGCGIADGDYLSND
jgi:hypothetical protein